VKRIFLENELHISEKEFIKKLQNSAANPEV
jgi:hypothetical protein